MRTRRIWLTLTLAVLAAVALGGCSFMTTYGNAIQGSGPTTTDIRTVGEFTRVDVGNGIRLEVAIGTPTGVKVVAEENLVPITRTSLSGDRLTVDTTNNYSTSKGITVTVTVPRLDEVQLTGGATGQALGVTAGTLVLGGQGGAHLVLTGTADDLRLSGNGGAAFDLAGLTVKRASVDLDGGVAAKVTVTDSVSGTANGGVVLKLLGNPATVNVSTEGGAVVARE